MPSRGTLLVAMLLLAACDPDPAGFGPLPSTSAPGPSPNTPTPSTTAPPARVVVVETPGYRYEPLGLTIEAGQEVILELRNPDSRPHTLTVNELNLQMA